MGYLSIESPGRDILREMQPTSCDPLFILGNYCVPPFVDFEYLEAKSSSVTALVDLRHRRQQREWPRYARSDEYRPLITGFQEELRQLEADDRLTELVDAEHFPEKLYLVVDKVYQGLCRASKWGVNMNIWINDGMREHHKKELERMAKFRESLKTWTIIDGKVVDLPILQS
jgi:hypothetical protein